MPTLSTRILRGVGLLLLLLSISGLAVSDDKAITGGVATPGQCPPGSRV
ncbi:Uncharacterised protein [Klebsiella pneumoniae]|uniref:Uncharacterized protein n=1 Tax=Klebsiella pneumoniae TaxID=573 RepID=A0A377U3Z8_KLEPN|nr:Uncharacterised protein [Klebsiella pneumoniae]